MDNNKSLTDKVNEALTALDAEAQFNNKIRAHNNALQIARPAASDNDKKLLDYINNQINEARKDKPVFNNEDNENTGADNTAAFINSINNQIAENRPRGFNELLSNNGLKSGLNDNNPAIKQARANDKHLQGLIDSLRDNHPLNKEK